MVLTVEIVPAALGTAVPPLHCQLPVDPPGADFNGRPALRLQAQAKGRPHRQLQADSTLYTHTDHRAQHTLKL